MELAAGCGVKVAATGNVHTMYANGTSCRTAWSPSKIARVWKKHTASVARIPSFTSVPCRNWRLFSMHIRSFSQYPENYRTLHTGPDQRPQLQLPRLCRTGRTDQDAYLEKLCHEAAIRRYGSILRKCNKGLPKSSA